jgi:hypothetical protein
MSPKPGLQHSLNGTNNACLLLPVKDLGTAMRTVIPENLLSYHMAG